MNAPKQLNVDLLLDDLVQHIDTCEELYVNCNECMFKIQRKGIEDHILHCEKT